MRVLWTPSSDRGTWYPIAPVIAGLIATGDEVVASGLPAAEEAAGALGVPYVADDLGLLAPEATPGAGDFEGRLDLRIRLAALSSRTLRPLLAGGGFDAVLADPFRYGAGLVARAEGVPWISYVHHCYIGDPVIDGLFQMSWDEHRGGEGILDRYWEWWSALRNGIGLGPEPRPGGDAWCFAVSDRLSLVIGPRRLVEEHLPPGGVAIGATPWEQPGAVPPEVTDVLGHGPVVLAAPPADERDFPLAATRTPCRLSPAG